MIDPALITLIVIALIATVLILLFFLPLRRSKDEVGATLLYEERCTGRKILALGFSSGGTIPNWRISFYEDFFVIASIARTKIPYGAVKSVEYARQLISKGIRIRVHSPRMDIVLFPKEPAKIVEIFVGKNVPISTEQDITTRR